MKVIDNLCFKAIKYTHFATHGTNSSYFTNPIEMHWFLVAQNEGYEFFDVFFTDFG